MITEDSEIVIGSGLSDRMSQVSEAATLRIAARASELRASGRKIVSLSTGEPDFPTPDNIKQAGIRAIEQNFTKYTPAEGLPELRSIVAKKFEEENGIHTSPDRIQISSGGKHALFNAVEVLVQQGDEVIIPSPYWVSYPAMVAIAEGTSVFVKTYAADRWVMTPEALDAAITPNTKAMILNTPVNPTSAMYLEEDLRALAPVIKASGMYVIVDELYEKLVYDGRKHFSLGAIEDIADQVITVNGLSKAYAMTGWRLGYATGPKEVIAAMNRLQSQAVSHPSSISQRAGIEALTGPQESIAFMRNQFQLRRDLVVELMRKIPGISFTTPEAAFYIFFDVAAFFGMRSPDDVMIDSADAICNFLLEECGLALVPGGAFGAPDMIRLSFAASEADIRQGVSLLQKGLSMLH